MADLFGSDAVEEEDDIAPAEEYVEDELADEPEDLTPRTTPYFMGHHDTTEKALLRDFNAGRMPHAVVLAGALGIGKATLAFRLARFLLAQDDGGLFGGDAAPVSSMDIAQDHPAFRRVASGGHPDLLVVGREIDEKRGKMKNDIAVDDVRRIHPFLRKTSSEGGWRIVIVDGGEYLNNSSQNALLKVLEEPPAKSMLIMTTTKPGAFLPTIRSRCRVLQMQPLEDETLSALLDIYAPGTAAHEKDTLIRMASGSIGRGLQYCQDGVLDLYGELAKTVAGLPDIDMLAVHDLAERLGRGATTDAYDAACDILSGWCLQEARAGARGTGVTDSPLSGLYTPRHSFEMWEKMTRLFQQVRSGNLDRRQGILGAFLMLKNPAYEGLAV
ncbi:MAG: DNA polymerase III subunit delta' [Alphaproteobacteria bacterium]|nr:DNA polymerase III subunit delta' [Alphaproteobacteria bacterium]